MKKTPEEIQVLSSSFYRTDRRDDGLWHLHRNPTLYNLIWNAQVITTAAITTTPDLRNPIYGIPPNAKGVLLNFAFTSAGLGMLGFAPNGEYAPTAGQAIRPGRLQVANQWCESWFAILFGLTAGVPNGRVDCRAQVANCTVTMWPIGYIA